MENIWISSKRKPNLIERDRGKDFYKNVVQNFVNNNNIKHYSRNTYLGGDFAERLNRTIRYLLKRPVFERDVANWVDVIPTVTKQYNNKIRCATKHTPIQASLKKAKDMFTRDYQIKEK